MAEPPLRVVTGHVCRPQALTRGAGNIFTWGHAAVAEVLLAAGALEDSSETPEEQARERGRREQAAPCFV